jgi:HEAT repeat protein
MEGLAEADTVLFFDHVAAMCLEDEDPIARATAIRLLWQSEDEKLAHKLLARLEEDPESIVRAAAATGLGTFVYQGEMEEISEETFKTILDVLIKTHTGNDDRLVRRRALESLGFASHPDLPGYIQQAYDSYEAVRAAGELEMSAAREALFDLIEEGTDDEDLYFAAIWALSKIGGQGVRKLIEASIEDAEDDEEVTFLEEALENLDFTEQTNMFDMMVFDDDDGDEDEDDWDDKDDDFDDDLDDDYDDEYDGYED